MLAVGPSSFRPFWVLILVGLCTVATEARGVVAQNRTEGSPATVRKALEQAEAALDRGEARAAVRILADAKLPVDRADPPDAGLIAEVAYRLGRAHRAAGQPRKALQVWQNALSAPAPGRPNSPASDVILRMKDAYVRTAAESGSGDDRVLATRYYLDLLACAGDVPSGAAGIVNRHLRQVVVVLPRAMQRRTGLTVTPTMDVRLEPTADAGSLLVAWWRAQDLLPATPENERLEEHLLRVAHAEAAYRHDETVDARGLVYIRFGTPNRATTVDFDNPHFRDRVIRRNPTLSRFDFPENEFWIYDNLGRAAYYLFIEEERGRFRVGDTKDLFPSSLRHGLSSTGRGYRKAYSLVHTMELVYRQLGLHHGDFLDRYAEATNAAAQLDMREFVDGPVAVNGRTAFEYSQTFLSLVEQEDAALRAEREEQVPPSASDLLASTPPVPVHVRKARFLEPDGTTRTEVYWSVGVQGLVPDDPLHGSSRDDYSLTTSVIQQTVDYRTQSVDRTVRTVRPDKHRANGLLRPQTHILRGGEDTYHVAVQWDQHRLDRGGSTASGPLVKRNVYRIDSLRALSASAGGLVLSDLKPLTLPGDRPTDVAPDLADAIPYPFMHLNPRTPLALYFEVYNLQFDGSDRTRYTVAYEVRAWNGDRGLWQQIVGGNDEQVTTTEVTYTGSSTRAREYIFIDQADWDATQKQDRVEIRVEVTDESTDQTESRSIQFRIDRSGVETP